MLMLEGSRNNVNIQKDDWQDYDITFFTEDMYKLYGKGN
ncbi:MAG TPA: aminoglycoside 6-adenylyltransferase [Candidatus Salinicoccus stercoripullorum]|uniref:Aminoglycoside 6-adenylyltransferase n=1 Tax=Candidatus Salinicoccus stercoripullorum TaxID=2838756 RepID=A0A9D1U0F0_9STAP|nr:aminoglycoside 6-adenylyltransferase [Candidatus Salinicoccus stercoripullorum]